MAPSANVLKAFEALIVGSLFRRMLDPMAAPCQMQAPCASPRAHETVWIIVATCPITICSFGNTIASGRVLVRVIRVV